MRNTMIFAAAAAGLLLGGCSATMKQTEGGSYLYESGRLESLEQAKLDKTWQASLDAMKDLELTLKETKKDALEAQLQAEQANGRSVKVRLFRVDDNTTRVQVRAGNTFSADESVGEVVLKTLRKRIDNPLPADQAGKPLPSETKTLAAEQTD